MAVIKMMMASLAMAAVAYALTPEEEAMLAKLAARKEAEENMRGRRAGHNLKAAAAEPLSAFHGVPEISTADGKFSARCLLLRDVCVPACVVGTEKAMRANWVG